MDALNVALPQLKALESAKSKVSAALRDTEETDAHFTELTNLIAELESHSQRLFRDPNSVKAAAVRPRL